MKIVYGNMSYTKESEDLDVDFVDEEIDRRYKYDYDPTFPFFYSYILLLPVACTYHNADNNGHDPLSCPFYIVQRICNISMEFAYQCLKEFDIIHHIHILDCGYGSRFDSFSAQHDPLSCPFYIVQRICNISMEFAYLLPLC
mgnify:CR=1 FL=1